MNLSTDIENTQELSQWENKTKEWFATHERKLEAESKGDTLKITIMDAIGGGLFFEGVTSSRIERILRDNPNAKNINVIVDSPGGDAIDGIAIHNLFRMSGARVTAEVVGEASSAASIIVMGADEVKMHTGSIMMIHSAAAGIRGNAADHRKMAEILDKADASLTDIYKRRNAKKSADEIKAMIEKETWMTASEAVEMGFADSVVSSVVKPKAESKPKVKAEGSPVITNTAPETEADPYDGLSDEEKADVEAGIEKRKAEAHAKALETNPLLRAMGEEVQPLGGMTPG